MALWTAGLAWCNRNLSDGRIPRSAALRLVDWETVADLMFAASPNGASNGVTNAPRNSAVAEVVARKLVEVGLWDITETGYEVHDYLDYQRSAEQVRAEAKNNAARQKRFRETHKSQDRNGVTNGPVTGAPNPNPNPQEQTPTESVREHRTAKPKVDKNDRDDVRALCGLMVDLVVANGSKRPEITTKWKDDARLLIDKDERDLRKALELMRWAAKDTFWRANVQSLPTFRKQYDQLRLKALAEWEREQQEAQGNVRAIKKPIDLAPPENVTPPAFDPFAQRPGA
jgi:hypothetical protein